MRWPVAITIVLLLGSLAASSGLAQEAPTERAAERTDALGSSRDEADASLVMGWGAPPIASTSTSNESAGEARVARGLFDRFVAPCCWTEALRSHDSPLARELRAEIVRRTREGESAAAIEQDLVARYGERVLTEPAGLDTVSEVLVLLVVIVALSIVGVVARRTRRTAREPEPVEAPRGPEDDALDRRLEEELARARD